MRKNNERHFTFTSRQTGGGINCRTVNMARGRPATGKSFKLAFFGYCALERNRALLLSMLYMEHKR